AALLRQRQAEQEARDRAAAEMRFMIEQERRDALLAEQSSRKQQPCFNAPEEDAVQHAKDEVLVAVAAAAKAAQEAQEVADRIARLVAAEAPIAGQGAGSRAIQDAMLAADAQYAAAMGVKEW
ncbi:MAG: hypothetical protein RR332_00235, partial [Clostridiales bacterium]